MNSKYVNDNGYTLSISTSLNDFKEQQTTLIVGHPRDGSHGILIPMADLLRLIAKSMEQE